MLTQKEIMKVARKFQKCGPLFTALGDEVRQHIIMILAETGVTGMNVSDIAVRTRLSRPAISHHLKVLKDVKMVASYKKGTMNFYFIAIKKNLEAIKDLITSVETLLQGVDTAELEKEAPWILNR